MSFIICIFLAIGIFIFSLVGAIVLSQKRKESTILSPFNLVAVGVFVSAMIIHLPIFYELFKPESFTLVKTVLMSIHNSIRFFVVDIDYFFIAENIPADIWVRGIYSVFSALLCLTAPLLTFGFILSFFKNLSAYLKYLSSYFKDVYIFSELNEKSITLASDIKANNKKAAIVFTDVFDDKGELSYELTEKAKTLGSVLFKKDILAVRFGAHSSSRKIYFLVMGENENENLSQALGLISTYGKMDNTNLYVFSNRIESELMLTHVEETGMRVRRINETRSLINRLLYENGKEVFDTAREQTDGKKLISALIVGMGRHGTEMIKALSWFCQMAGYRVEINAFDKDSLAEDKFSAQCPELMSPRYNGVYVEGEAQYKITIHSGIDVETATFANEIYKLTDTTYVLCTLGSDEMNIKTSVNLRMLFERMKIKPKILSIVYQSKAKEMLSGISNYRGQPYDIEFIGDIKSSYSENVVIDSELEERALARHLKWGKESDFWKYEYNYRSSMASAIHMNVRDKLGIPGANKNEEDLTEEEIKILEPLEHCRWNAYMRSEGYIYSGSPDKESRNDLAKMHHNLIVFEDLTLEDKLKDRSVGSK